MTDADVTSDSAPNTHFSSADKDNLCVSYEERRFYWVVCCACATASVGRDASTPSTRETEGDTVGETDGLMLGVTLGPIVGDVGETDGLTLGLMLGLVVGGKQLPFGLSR